MNITIGGKNREITEEQLEQINELLKTELRTPSTIHFDVGMGKGNVYGLFFNRDKQILYFPDRTKQWFVRDSGANQIFRTGRKLVPINREDLKPGDVAYRDDDEIDTGGYLECYCVILDEKYIACVCSDTDIVVDNSVADYWWKVV